MEVAREVDSLLTPLRIFGVIAFKFVDRRFIRSRRLLFFCLVNGLALTAYRIILGKGLGIIRPEGVQLVLRFILPLESFCMSALVTVIVLLSFKDELFNSFVKKLSLVDDYIIQQGTYRKYKGKCYVHIIVFLLVFAAYVIRGAYSRDLKMSLILFPVYWFYFETIAVGYFLSGVVSVLSHRFLMIREIIKNKPSVNGVENVLKSYELLLSAFDDLKVMMSLPILVFIFSAFSVFLGELYTAVNIWNITAKGLADILNISIKMLWSASGALNGLSLILECSQIPNEAREFNIHLYQLMIDDKTNIISNNKKLRLHISMKREIVFTACGFFALDYTLVHSMIAAATTYLVILIQFGQPTTATDSGQTTTATIGSYENYTTYDTLSTTTSL